MKIPFEWKEEIDSIIRGANKLYNRTQRHTKEREPLLIEHISRFNSVYNPTSQEDKFDKLLILVTLVIGFRTLFRPSDLASMKWSDVKVDKPHFNWITIKDWWHKTDQDGRNHNVVVIEPAKNTLICPVAIIKQYITEVENIKHPNSPFLSQKDNLFLTRDDICYFLKFLCKVLNIKDHLTGHSMRIGSATK